MKCNVLDCNRGSHTRGYCHKHYEQFRKHGDPLFRSPRWHGMAKASIYMTWCNIKARCFNPNAISYKNYGARGIKVCERWKYSFKHFLSDMGPKPGPQYEIDRIDNDGNYEPGNCRWISHTENNRNKRTTKLSEQDVKLIKKMYLSGNYYYPDIAAIFGVCSVTISQIIREKIWKNIA